MLRGSEVAWLQVDDAAEREGVSGWKTSLRATSASSPSFCLMSSPYLEVVRTTDLAEGVGEPSDLPHAPGEYLSVGVCVVERERERVELNVA